MVGIKWKRRLFPMYDTQWPFDNCLLTGNEFAGRRTRLLLRSRPPRGRKAAASLNWLLAFPGRGATSEPGGFSCCLSPSVSPAWPPSLQPAVFPWPDPEAHLICSSPTSWIKFWELKRGSDRATEWISEEPQRKHLPQRQGH